MNKALVQENRRSGRRKKWDYGIPSVGSKVFDVVNVLFMLFLMIITLYPFLYVLFASLSNPLKLYSHSGLLLHPLGFSLKGYQFVLNYRSADRLAAVRFRT